MSPGDPRASDRAAGNGQLAWPIDPERRFRSACEVAGVLAESGVQALTISDPRACRSWTLEARRANLPRVLADCAEGTVLNAPGVSLCVEGECLRWVADGPIGDALRSIAAAPHEDRST